MSDEKKREKKWRKKEVKEKILRYLAEKGRATKYQIQKELGISLSTVLQAMKDLEKDGLIEYEIGKRESHICRLTMRGLIYCIMNKILKLDEAIDYFIYLLKSKNMDVDELAQEFGVPNDLFLILIKMTLIYYGLGLESLKRDIEHSKQDKKIYHYILHEPELLDKQILIKLLKIYNKIFEYMIYSPWFQLILMNYGLSKGEIERFKEYIFKKDDIERTFLFDYEENKWFTKLKKFGMFRKWLFIGCIAICMEFRLDIDKLMERIAVDSDVDLRELFDIRIVEVKKVEQEDLCPLNDFCDYDFSNFRDAINCEKFRKLVLLQKEGKWVIGK